MRRTTVRKEHMPSSSLNADRIPLDARGHYTIGKEMIDGVVDRIRRIAGTCYLKATGVRIV